MSSWSWFLFFVGWVLIGLSTACIVYLIYRIFDIFVHWDEYKKEYEVVRWKNR